MWMLYIEASHRFLYILLIIRMYCFAKRVLLQQHHLLLTYSVNIVLCLHLNSDCFMFTRRILIRTARKT